MCRAASYTCATHAWFDSIPSMLTVSSVAAVNKSPTLSRALRSAIRHGACGVIEKPVNYAMLCVRARVLIDRFCRAEDTYQEVTAGRQVRWPCVCVWARQLWVGD